MNTFQTSQLAAQHRSALEGQARQHRLARSALRSQPTVPMQPRRRGLLATLTLRAS